jgi:tetratricopeptide (TPR) repeat protein
MTTHAESPTVFISYSHKDESWKNLLTPHLKVLAQAGRIDIWDDRKIDGGSQWFNDIKEAIDRAAVAVCLISADYLASDFCVKEEIPYLLARRDRTVLVILPTLLHPCVWEVIEWLEPTQMIPRDGKSISGDFKGNENEAFRQVAKSVLEIVNDPNRKRPEPPPPSWPMPLKVETKRLPVTGSELFGRQRELKMLDKVWDSASTHVVSLVAWGGVGKSTLANKWLERMEADNYRGARRVYAWSFYSQGTNERVTSADLFINNALEWFGDPEPTAGSPWDKGERLARLVRAEKTLIVLDGLEPLQSPHAHERGKIKDPALSTLLSELARENQGLCLITTRERVTDLEEFSETVCHEDLEQISDEAGRALLRVGGVRGTDAELEQATRDFGNHALAVQLLAVYLHEIPGHHVSNASEVPDLDIPEEKGKHPRRMLAAFQQRFGEGPEVELLRMLGLFDRPADAASLAALRAAPPIPSLTDHTEKLSEADWLRVISKLRRAKLIATASQHHADDTLDAHPLVREHFGEQLKEQHPNAWREGNSRLYEHLRDTTIEFPDTIEEMTPLYAAVAHGCAAGRYQEALDEMYWDRISRGDRSFNMKNLGAVGANLAILVSFFNLPWQQPVSIFNEDDAAYLLGAVGLMLRSLGRFVEAAQPLQASLGVYLLKEDWTKAARVTGNLSELYLDIGDLSQAIEFARKGIELADRGGSRFEQIVERALLANSLYQANRLSESEAVLREAEGMQKEMKPEVYFLYSIPGFRYCALLLHQSKYQEVQARAAHTLGWAKQFNASLLTFALDYLSLGRAHLLQARHEATDDFRHTTDYLNRAVNGLRQAGTLNHVPRGLLARAELRRVKGELEEARVDLNEAMSIATRGGMALYQADCHLEYARLYLAEDPRDVGKAQEHLVKAREMIERMGYHLRDEAVREIEAQLEAVGG